MTDASSSELLELGPPLVVALVLLVAAGTCVAWLGQTGHARQLAWASVRATVQLTVLGTVLSYIVGSLWLTAAFLTLMSCAATWTAASRITAGRPGPRALGLTLLAVAVPANALVVALTLAGVVPARGIAIIPTVGIVMGGAMTTAALAGQRARHELRVRHGEVEAGLALGLDGVFIRLEVCRSGAATALIPALDQTRTVGLVTIPGAFVGMVLGGASPLHAGFMQLFVLIALLANSPIALVAVTQFVARGWYDAS
ncbi:ABC transporter permease [Tsukamurella sp. 8F]|uniref:ABC transporter permease n=1 Tax=unclassified Tsukamurella TaxID=2633480 RepID=UPI0023B942E3|nr:MULTISPECIES: ABC transporter permease [unclassified Tsukamurella]MDF0530611.1 ABC transporter permease [Tsukamurella sp. 8J]MDF0587812.1 ABC transporter permease [Tsukamurella sp. 8F]